MGKYFLLLLLAVAVCKVSCYPLAEEDNEEIFPEDLERRLTDGVYKEDSSTRYIIIPGGPIRRGYKRNSRDNEVYHPIPRVINMNQRSTTRNQQEQLEGRREKRQTRSTTLILRLGAWGLRNGKKPERDVNPTPAPEE